MPFLGRFLLIGISPQGIAITGHLIMHDLKPIGFRTEHGQHAIGCPGLDTPFEEWPMRNLNSEIYATAAMDCGKQTYMGLADIVEK